MSDASEVAKIEALSGYFRRHIPGCEVKQSWSVDGQRLELTLSRESLVYAIEFDREFLAEHDASSALRALDEQNVVGELCRGEGLKYLLTNRGLRLDSSN